MINLVNIIVLVGYARAQRQPRDHGPPSYIHKQGQNIFSQGWLSPNHIFQGQSYPQHKELNWDNTICLCEERTHHIKSKCFSISDAINSRFYFTICQVIVKRRSPQSSFFIICFSNTEKIY